MLLAEQGKLPLHFIYPAGTYTCPATLLNKCELHFKDWPKHYLLSGASKGLVLFAPLPFFA